MIGNFERHAVEELAHASRALLEIDEGPDGAAQHDGDEDAVVLHELREVDDQLREGRQIGAESLEQGFELRNHEDQQHDRHDDCHDQHGSRVEQGLLDLLLQGLGLLLVGRDLVEQRLERAGLLAGLDEIHEQVVEIKRVLAERLVQRGAAFDVRLDVENQLLHRRLVVAVADDLEGLHQRNARGQHGGELTAEDRDVAGVDLAAPAALTLACGCARARRPGGAVRRAGSAHRARGSCP